MSDLMITGVIDGPLTGGVPKAVQFYALDDIPDLSIYGVGAANNGGGTDGEEFTFPADMIPAGTTFYVSFETDDFTTYFGFPPDYTSGAVSINGDDAIELFQNGVAVDILGDVNSSSSSDPWNYQDGWASRDPSEGPSATFDAANWTFSGRNALDGETSNATAASPLPFAKVIPPAPEPVEINEFRISSSGSSDNTSNFVELFTTPGTSLNGKTLIALSGEFEPGQIDFAISLDGAVADDDGFVLIANDQNPNLEAGDVGVAGLDFFGSPQTFLVVDGYVAPTADPVTGEIDLDTDNDGVLDTAPWTDLLASVSLLDGDSTPDVSYAAEILPADGNFTRAAAARETDGTGAFAGLDFGDQSGDTPGSTNTPVVSPDTFTIMEIQGAGHVSSLVSATPLDPTTGATGPRVTTSGIVTAVDSNGFYLQDPTGDGDIATSDAIFVFTSSTPGVAVGDDVTVTGTVSEFYPGGQGTGNLSTTQLSGSPDITVNSSGNALPAAVVLGNTGRALPNQNIEDDNFTSFDVTTDGIDFYESLEGMLVTAPEPVAVSGTNQFGEVFVVVDGGADATGISDRGTLNISPDDFNPEKVQIDWDNTISPSDTIDVSVGAVFDDITGVVSYAFGNYEIIPTEQVAVFEASLLEQEVTELAGTETHLTIASYNVLNLDPIVEVQGNTNNGEARNVDDDIGDGRFTAIAEQIVNNLGSPDIIGLQEVQDNTGGEINDGVVSASVTFQTLIDAIDLADDGLMNNSSGYGFIDNTFITDQQSGGQPGGNIRTGFLFREDRVSVVEDSVQTIGSQAAGGEFAGARLPLVATFDFNGEEVTVVNNHFSSKGGSAPILGVEQDFAARQEDVNVNGSLDERQAQSAAVSTFVTDALVADADANLVVLGDMNEFEFISPVTGLEDAGLTNLTNTLAEEERYSFNFQGNSQSLDHILVSDALVDDAIFDVVHTNSEFAATDDRASDHDPLLVQLSFDAPVPDTVEVAVALETRGFFTTRAEESLDGIPIDTDRLPVFSNTYTFDDLDVKLDAQAPGFEQVTFLRGELGVWSSGDNFFKGELSRVNDNETLSFEFLEGDLGDAVAAMFEFGTVSGNGDVEVVFLDDGNQVASDIYDASAGPLAADAGTLSFDEVEISAVGDTAFSLVGFTFDRFAENPLAIA